MNKIAKPFLSAAVMALSATAIPAASAQSATAPQAAFPAAQPDYAEFAAQVIEAPLIIDAAVRRTSRVRAADAAGLAPGHVRYYVTAQVQALIRGNDAVASEIGYLVDLPFDARGRAPRINRLRVLLFARPVAGRPQMVQLITNQSQHAWTPETDSLVRRIATEAVSPNAPPAITGVGNAFHTPGVLPGEGETQIFLLTAREDPISLSIRRTADGRRNWAVSLGEIISANARPPQRDTLLWYRLACGLPRSIGRDNIAADLPEHATIVREDYAFVLRSLGPCHGSGVPATQPRPSW